MREEYYKKFGNGKKIRITPAHAGRMPQITSFDTAEGDHPRACGKNVFLFFITLRLTGSPPRMREESETTSKGVQIPRITPAHAGRIDLHQIPVWLFWDHPRACGKNLLIIPIYDCIVGSPPRMREEFTVEQVATLGTGITPAHAGRILKNSINIAILYQLLP